jgi:hypothetical protein
MKNLCIILASGLIFLACAQEQKEKSSDGIGQNDIIYLKEEQVSNFVNMLPEVLKFSDLYYSRLSKEEKEAADANDKFFKALERDRGIKAILPVYHFSSPQEMIRVYKNIVLEYTTITRDFTNYSRDFENMRMTIDSYRSNYITGLQDKLLSDEDKKLLESRLRELERDVTRLSNIVLVRKYEKKIDDAYIKFYGKNQ